MGLLGVVLEVTLQLRRVPSPYLDVQVSTARNLEELVERLEDIQQTADFIVVWLDTYARGPQLGRAVIHATRWLPSNASPAELERAVTAGVERLAAQKRRALAFFAATRPLINLGFQWQRVPARLFNAFYYNMHRVKNALRAERPAASKPELFLAHNFDKSYVVPPPDILCGPLGYTVQMTIPATRGLEAMKEMLELCERMPCPPATTILRLHRKDEFLLSFSDDGYSLNVEFHPKRRHVAEMHRRVSELIECGIRYGSRVHLPKDSVLTRAQFEKIFPRYAEFAATKRRIDPDGLFQSDLYRRLFRAGSPTERSEAD
jgi:decaprenylphospho-beta-D-ribofuranose 2-oxidase